MKPSTNRIHVSIPDYGGQVTAPANGYYNLQRFAIQPEGAISLINLTRGLRITVTAGNRGNPYLRCFVPVAKNDMVQVEYVQVNSSVDEFLFIYAGN